MLTVPNLITLSRFVAVAGLLVATAGHNTTLSLGALAYALWSDAIDGPVARATGTETALGARLDSTADLALYLTAPLAMYLLFPWLHAQATAALVAIYAGYLVPVAFGFLKYQRLTSYHTIGARIAAGLLAGAFFWSLIAHVTWPIYIAAGVLLVAAVEEILITWTLPEWRANVPSIWHAARLRAANLSQ